MHRGDEWKVKLMEDNQATITSLQQGQSQNSDAPTARKGYAFVGFKSSSPTVNSTSSMLISPSSSRVLTKAFDSTPVWRRALGLIGMSPQCQARAKRTPARKPYERKCLEGNPPRRGLRCLGSLFFHRPKLFFLTLPFFQPSNPAWEPSAGTLFLQP